MRSVAGFVGGRRPRGSAARAYLPGVVRRRGHGRADGFRAWRRPGQPRRLVRRGPAAGDPRHRHLSRATAAPGPAARRGYRGAGSSGKTGTGTNGRNSSRRGRTAVPGAVELEKIPYNVQTVPASVFEYSKSPDFLQSLAQSLPGVSLGDQTGNGFQLDINYRGFVAGPVIGTPQGLAVYQNGVRINEVFGDIVNWDFIPQNAINQLTLVPSNPVYGLNAIGGALSLEMKNGFTYHGVEGEVSGGSYGRITTSMQAGGEVGNLSGYITADAINDAGWRQNSPSTLRRVFADLGARGDQTEFHVNFTGADNTFGAAAATPVEMLNQSWSSTYTIPQTTHNQLAFLTASANWKPSDTWTYTAIGYYRNFHQSHVDGNGTDVSNDPTVCPDPTVLCFPNLDGTVSNLTTTRGQTIPNAGAVGDPNILGEIDRTWTTTNSFGGTLQAASSERVFGRVHQAKTTEKREAKIAELMAMLRRGETIHPCRVARGSSS